MAALEALLNFAVPRAFRKAAVAIDGNHPAPERHRAGIAQILDDFPVPSEAVENQLRGVAAHAHSAVLAAHEEFRHSIVRSGFPRCWNPRARHQREPHRIGSLENQQRMRVIVRKPVGKDFVFVRVIGAKNGKQPRIEVGEGVYVFTVDALDPLAIIL